MLCVRNTRLIFICRNLQHFNIYRLLNSNIPEIPTALPNTQTHNKTKIDTKTVSHLERLSLVNFGNEKGIKILEDAIEFAEQITSVNTKDVEPLITVLENCELRLREDIVTDGNCRKEILKNASVIEEDYFVAPPGNIPLITKSYSTDETKIKTENSNCDISNKKTAKSSNL